MLDLTFNTIDNSDLKFTPDSNYDTLTFAGYSDDLDLHIEFKTYPVEDI